MSWMDHRRAAFSLKGPFLAKRTGNAGDLLLQFGEVYTYAQLRDGNVADRVIARMYDGYWIDMAPDAPEPATEAPQAAAAPVQAAAAAEAPQSPENARSGDVQPEAEGAAEGEAGAAPVEGETATAPAETTVAAYKSAGFGKYWPLNAAGERIGDKPLTKVQAEGLANSAQVPLLGQTEPFPAE